MNVNLEKTPEPNCSDFALVTKAMLRAANYLEVTNADLAKVLGVSPSTISRIKAGATLEEGKPAELAILLIRLFRSLDAIVGGDVQTAARWLRADNTPLGGVPLKLIQTIHGMTNVVSYLDARRAVL